MAAREGQPRLHSVPMSFRQACAWVSAMHRHNKPPRGHKFSVAAADEDGCIHGVVMVGRPIARAWDDGLTLEVNRTVTDGTANVNSFLYGKAWRIAREMGFTRLVTYTQADESGISLRAAGWTVIGHRPPRYSWRDSTKRPDLAEMRAEDGSGGIARLAWEVRAW